MTNYIRCDDCNHVDCWILNKSFYAGCDIDIINKVHEELKSVDRCTAFYLSCKLKTDREIISTVLMKLRRRRLVTNDGRVWKAI